MSFKIPCGGFRLDEKSFSLDDRGVMSVSGGGFGGCDYAAHQRHSGKQGNDEGDIDR